MIHWETHTCSWYCTDEVHAFEMLGCCDISIMREEIIRVTGIPHERIMDIRAAPEAQESFLAQQNAYADLWTFQTPASLDFTAYLLFIRMRRGEQPETL